MSLDSNDPYSINLTKNIFCTSKHVSSALSIPVFLQKYRDKKSFFIFNNRFLNNKSTYFHIISPTIRDCCSKKMWMQEAISFERLEFISKRSNFQLNLSTLQTGRRRAWNRRGANIVGPRIARDARMRESIREDGKESGRGIFLFERRTRGGVF